MTYSPSSASASTTAAAGSIRECCGYSGRSFGAALMYFATSVRYTARRDENLDTVAQTLGRPGVRCGLGGLLAPSLERVRNLRILTS